MCIFEFCFSIQELRGTFNITIPATSFLHSRPSHSDDAPLLESVHETFKDRKSVKPAAQKSSKKRLRREAETLDGFGECGLDLRGVGCSELPEYLVCGVDVE